MTHMGLVIDLPADALFDYDKASLTQEAEAELRKAAEVIRQSPPGAIRIIGHTDDHGSDGYNKTLSEERANRVAQWFRQQVGVRQREFQVSGLGESKPVAPNRNAQGADDPQGRARNRRVELVIPTAP
jgi:outer membrane protein OmpA-like peptidoglycan-associated protein